MWIKVSVAVALFALLAWSVFKLFHLNRRQRILKRSFREPILNSKTLAMEDECANDLLDNPKWSSNAADDTDFVLGLKAAPMAKNEPAPEVQAETSSKAKASATIIIHLMAPANKPYMGYELLQALLAEGLRFGVHNIFHRHENRSGTGAYLFHLASVNAPGTFELSKMGSFSCPGLSLFMQLNDKIDNIAAFEAMLDTANELLNQLGGELWDEQRKSLSMDKITEYRLKIKEYQQSEANRLPDFFEQYS